MPVAAGKGKARDKDPEIVVAFDEVRHQFVTMVRRPLLDRWEEAPVWLYESALAACAAGPGIPALKSVVPSMDELKHVWTAMRRREAVDEIRCTVAQGFHAFPDRILELDPANLHTAYLTIPPGGVAPTWRIAVLEAHLNRLLARHDIKGRVHPGQLRTMYLRAVHYGEAITRAPLSIRPVPEVIGFSGPYHLVADYGRLSADLYVRDVDALENALIRRQIHLDVDEAMWRLATAAGGSPASRRANTDLDLTFSRARTSPQRLGLNLPLILPVGFVLREEAEGARLGDPAVLAALLGFGDEGLTPDERQMLGRRNLISAQEKSRRAHVIPVVALEHADEAVRRQHFAIATRGREALGFQERELQALTLAVTAESAGSYRHEIDEFWRALADEAALLPPAPGDTLMFVLSFWVPLSTPWAERKAPSDVVGSRPHDNGAWLALLVREMLALPITKTPEGLATCLIPEVSEGAIDKALKGLTTAGLVNFNSYSRQYEQAARNVVTGDDMPSEKIHRLHCEMAKLAESLIATRPLGAQHRALALRIKPDKFGEMKQRLRAKLVALLTKNASEKRPEWVATLGTQLFLLADPKDLAAWSR